MECTRRWAVPRSPIPPRAGRPPIIVTTPLPDGRFDPHDLAVSTGRDSCSDSNVVQVPVALNRLVDGVGEEGEAGFQMTTIVWPQSGEYRGKGFPTVVHDSSE